MLVIYFKSNLKIVNKCLYYELLTYWGEYGGNK